MKTEKICPRCGLKYSYIERRKVGNQTYLLAVHYLKMGSRRKIKKCYLGPEDKYIYVSKMHEFSLRGPVDRLRILNYLDAILNILVLEREKLGEKTRREVVGKLMKTVETFGGKGMKEKRIKTANLLLNLFKSRNKMFSIVTQTWNPISGCSHNCVYCYARRLAETRLKHCPRYMRGFIPRLNENEFNRRFKDGEFVFVVDMGDLFSTSIPKDWIFRVLRYVEKFPKTHFLFLTKNPARYSEFIDYFSENCYLGATIETNRDDLYKEYRISRAPPPSSRYRAMVELDWDKKFISIEPILDFNLDIFVKWIREIDPLIVYIGYDNYNNGLPEPKLAKTLKLVEELEEFTLVLRKTIREALGCSHEEGYR